MSIDLFRGLTIWMMVFVNDLAGVSGIPGWMKHAAADADAMTFVDVVFPAFLFIVGMAIPFAINKRFARGEPVIGVIGHTIIRTISLLVLGVFMVNSGEMNTGENLIPKWLWDVLLYVSAILIWNVYPKSIGWKKHLFTSLRIVGLFVLAFLWFTFRKTVDGELIGMTPSWWGILGLIGWAYFIVVILFILIGKDLYVSTLVLILLFFLSIGLHFPGLELPGPLHWLKSLSREITHVSIVMSGLVLSIILTKGKHLSQNRRIINFLLYAVLLFAGGFLIRPAHGISKIYATPSWAMYSSAFCILAFAVVYWISDVKGWKFWNQMLRPAGYNPLLTYILPFIFYAIAGFGFLPQAFNEGIPGFLRSVVFAFFILGIAGLLTRLKIRLHL